MKIKSINQRQIIQLVTLLGLIFSIWLLIYFKLHPNLLAVGGTFQLNLAKMGIWAPVLFILLQMIQVIYPIIPGGMTSVIGHIVFGPLMGFMYNFTGIFLGSLAAFGLARRYGKSFAGAFVSEATYDKYTAHLEKNDGRLFAKLLGLAFALPGFPDDFLCMVAGMSKMSWKQFIWIFLLTKPATLYLYTLISYKGLNWLLTLF